MKINNFEKQLLLGGLYDVEINKSVKREDCQSNVVFNQAINADCA